MNLNTIKEIFNKGDYIEALNECDKLLNENDSNIEVLIIKTIILALPDPIVSNPNLAVMLLKKALAKDPSNANLHKALGDAFNNGAGDYESALTEYKKVLEINPSSALTYYSIASLYQHPGVNLGLEETIFLLEKAVSLNPEDWQVHRDLGLRYWEAGRTEYAAAELDNALKKLVGYDDYSRRQIRKWIEKIKIGQDYKEGFFSK